MFHNRFCTISTFCSTTVFLFPQIKKKTFTVVSLWKHIISCMPTPIPFLSEVNLQKYSSQITMWREQPESSIHLFDCYFPLLPTMIFSTINVSVPLSPLLDLSPSLRWQLSAVWPILQLLKHFLFSFLHCSSPRPPRAFTHVLPNISCDLSNLDVTSIACNHEK